MQINGPVNFCLFIIKFVIYEVVKFQRAAIGYKGTIQRFACPKELIVIASKLNMFSLKITEKKKRKVGECASIL